MVGLSTQSSAQVQPAQQRSLSSFEKARLNAIVMLAAGKRSQLMEEDGIPRHFEQANRARCRPGRRPVAATAQPDSRQPVPLQPLGSYSRAQTASVEFWRRPCCRTPSAHRRRTGQACTRLPIGRIEEHMAIPYTPPSNQHHPSWYASSPAPWCRPRAIVVGRPTGRVCHDRRGR
jgi:hypothetical protein